ncbi:MAG: peptidylprolyl isomerase [Gemmatimonadales bacterium]
MIAILLLRAVAAGGLLTTEAGAFQERPAPAPAPGDSVVDRIVAVVATKAILRSQVQERIFQASLQQGQSPPTDPAARTRLEREILDLLVNEELLVQEAQRDTAIKVLEEDVTKAVDITMRAVRGRYPNEAAYRNDLRAAGFETPDEYRLWLTEQQRRELQIRDLISRLQSAGRLKPVNPTESEMRQYFDEHKASFGKRSESVSFRQLIVAPSAKPEAKARARALADSILSELRKGADFPTAARRFSMDPQSREAGGEIGWVRRGIGLDQRFEDVAFALRPGVVSDPVETPFGYHLIQVTRSQPAEVQVRHILIRPDIDQQDADSASRTAQRIREALLQGASFDSLQRIWHDRAEERDLEGIPMEVLPETYREALQGVPGGGVSPVFPLQEPGNPARSKYAVVVVTERIPAGDIRYEDVKEQIRQGLSQQLTNARYIDRLKSASLVEIKSP